LNYIDSLIENRFKEHITSWLFTIESILKNVNDKTLAWRFIKINPKIELNINSVTLNKDFIDFTNLLIQRRDIDHCDYKELGNLCALHTAFQRQIENQITSE
jgi:hypothetical protein